LYTVLKSSLNGDWSVNKRNPGMTPNGILLAASVSSKPNFINVSKDIVHVHLYSYMYLQMWIYTHASVYMFNMSITINYFIELFLSINTYFAYMLHLLFAKILYFVA